MEFKPKSFMHFCFTDKAWVSRSECWLLTTTFQHQCKRSLVFGKEGNAKLDEESFKH